MPRKNAKAVQSSHGCFSGLDTHSPVTEGVPPDAVAIFQWIREEWVAVQLIGALSNANLLPPHTPDAPGKYEGERVLVQVKARPKTEAKAKPKPKPTG
jgi:hypothetical protein